MKIIIFFILIITFFTGCAEVDLNAMQAECRKNGQTLKVEKVFNYREGKYVDKAECR